LLARPLERGEIEELYGQYGRRAQRLVRRLLGDTEAQDVMHDAFVRAMASQATFRWQSRPSTWLYRIVTNLCLNRIRDVDRRRARLAQFAEAQKLRSGVDAALAIESRVTLVGLFAGVSEDLARVATHYFVDGMDQAEIASLLRVPRRTVGHRLDRFRKFAFDLVAPRCAVGTSEPKRARCA